MAPVRFYYQLDRRVTTRVHARSHPIQSTTNASNGRTDRDDNNRVITIAHTHNTHLE